MASLQRYTSNGRTYWRLVESRRVHGKPRVFVLRHIGSADNLASLLQASAVRPEGAQTFDLGALAALWDIATELKVVEIVDQHTPKREQGLSVGQYCLLAALNRCVDPRSKAQFAGWYRRTVLRRLLPAVRAQLTSQRFWDHMGFLTKDALRRIEEDLVHRLVEHFKIDLRALLFDATNFDTYIDSSTLGELARRGHAKSKRMDLRIVGLALLVSADFHVPLLWDLYPGNQPDSVTFSHAVEALVQRYRVFAKECQRITLVFDKGNNSEENIEALDQTPYDFVGSLVPHHFAELLDIPLGEFRELTDPRLKGVRVKRTQAKVLGKVRPVLVTHSQSLLRGQLRGIEQHLARRRRKLRSLQQKVYWSYRRKRGGKGYTVESVQNHLKTLTSGQYLKDFLRAEVHQQGEELKISFWVDQDAFERLRERVLGRRILFARDEDRTDEEFVLTYRAQYHVEAAFRQMKEPCFVRFSPMFHWTDSRIRAHAFHCVLALTLGNLLHRKVIAAGIQLSAGKMLAAVGGIKEVMTLESPSAGQTPGKRGPGRPRQRMGLLRMDDTQKRLFELLQLDRYQAK